MDDVSIDPMNGVPVSQQLADLLRAAIQDGTYQPRTAIPSAKQLSEQHGVSVGTAVKAVAVLRDEGLVVGVPGRGVFVTDRA
jgi:DNA-binding GntR family transcriptional regulator